MYKISSRWFLRHHSGRFAMTPGQKHRKYTINCPQLVFIGYHKVMYPVELAVLPVWLLGIPHLHPVCTTHIVKFLWPWKYWRHTLCFRRSFFVTVSMPFNSILVFNGFWNFFLQQLEVTMLDFMTQLVNKFSVQEMLFWLSQMKIGKTLLCKTVDKLCTTLG